MPKAAPDQIIIHRIEFQETERQMLQDLTTVWSFNRVMDPLVRLINDNTTLLLILSGAAAWLGFTYVPPLLEDAYNQLQDWKAQFDAAVAQGVVAQERLELVGGLLTRGPLWGLLDILSYLGDQESSAPSTFGGVTAEERAAAGY
jgi:hypothetical protein